MTVTPTLTTCEMCNAPMAALPGPMRKLGRPTPPNGYLLGYIVEDKDGAHPICQPCVSIVLQPVA